MKSLFFLSLAAVAFAKSSNKTPLDPIPITIEARFSYFWPEASEVRDVFGNGGVDYQLTGTVPFYQGENFGLRGLNFWWGIDYFNQNGRSIALNNKINIQAEPLTAGLKWIYPQYSVRPFIGAALKYYFVQTHNHNPFVKERVSVNAPGFAVEAGVQLFLAKYLMMDLFASYSYIHLGAPSINLSNIQSTSLDLGGLNFGGGLGTKF